MPHFLVHTARDTRRVVDTADIYHVESVGRDTLIRRRGARRLKDVRELHELVATLQQHGLIQIHRKHIINPAFVHELRKREGKQDWELKMSPPVNTVLPIARDYLDALWQHLGEP